MNVAVENTDDWVITDELFGGNVLASRDVDGGMDGWGEAIEDLNVTSLRYPGGSLTELYFDIERPNDPIVTHIETGEESNFIPLSEFMNYASEGNHAVSIVIPTRTQLSEETDRNGDRFPNVDEEALRTFIRDISTGIYGDAKVQAFEIGNEYWHSGEMNSLEYGRLAIEMSRIITDELNNCRNNFDIELSTEVLVQMGHNYGTADMEDRYEGLTTQETINAVNTDYGLDIGEEAFYTNSHRLNWTYINNEVIKSFFSEPEDLATIDGVIAHVYTFGEGRQSSRIWELDNLAATWTNDHPELSIHVTEWNLKGVTASLDRHEDYGLYQAEELLNILEEFVRYGVDYAQVWPLIQRTDNSFSQGNEYFGQNAPGTMFADMARVLPGKRLIDLDPFTTDTEISLNGFSVHGFSSSDSLTFYIFTDHVEGSVSLPIDLSLFVAESSSAIVEILEVDNGSAPGSNRSLANWREYEVLSGNDELTVVVDFDPGEIVRVELTNPFSIDDEVIRDLASSVVDGEYQSESSDMEPENVTSNIPSELIQIFSGSSDNDTINVSDTRSEVYARGGNDLVVGGHFNDLIDSGWGNDTVYGMGGEDILIGHRGDDIFFGGEGEDRIHGGRGNDYIDGGLGNDVLYGELGEDTFIFRLSDGHDIINDFSIEEDRIQIESAIMTPNMDLEELIDYTAVITESGVQISFFDDSSILLSGLNSIDGLSDVIFLI